MSKYNRMIKSCYKYFLSNIETYEYIQYVQKQKADQSKTWSEYVSKERPELVERIDIYENSRITQVKICDILSNNGISEVIKSLYSLPKSKYTVNNYYKKSSFIMQLDYIRLQVSGKSRGCFADIKFIDDKYIDNIEIVWTQLDSYSALLEYTFSFKRSLDEKLQRKFVLDGIRKLSKKDFRPFYMLCENSEDNFMWMLQLEDDDLVLSICQHYITTLLFSERGKNEKLSNMIFLTRENPIDISTLCMNFSGDCYFNKEHKYLVTGYDGNYYLLAGSNVIPNFSITGCIFKYGVNFYYDFNGRHELKQFEHEFSKYSTGRKRVSKKELILLLNRLQGLKECNLVGNSSLYAYIDDKWDVYRDNKKIDTIPASENMSTKIKEIYDISFSYFRTRADIELANTNRKISLVALIVALIGVIVSISQNV